jgi:hypothetical protein
MAAAGSDRFAAGTRPTPCSNSPIRPTAFASARTAVPCAAGLAPDPVVLINPNAAPIVFARNANLHACLRHGERSHMCMEAIEFNQLDTYQISSKRLLARADKGSVGSFRALNTLFCPYRIGIEPCDRRHIRKRS